MIDGTRRGARRGIVAAALFACCVSYPAAAGAATKSASDIAPIIGTWNDGGAVIEVTGGGGSFQGTVVSGQAGSCDSGGPGTVFWKGLTGSSFSYSGQLPFVHSDDCTSAGDGPATFTLSDINHGSWSATSPGDGMTYTGSFTRQGTWPGADNGGGKKPKTNCKKKGHPVLCAQQKKTVKKVVKAAKKTLKVTKGFKAAGIPKQSNKLGQLTVLSTQAGKTAAQWRDQKLPKTRAQAKAKFGSPVAAKDWSFIKALSNFNSKIAAIGNQFYSQPEPKVTLDQVAFDLYGGRSYSQLSTDEKAGAYSKAWQSPSNGGHVISVDPQTGKIPIQLYGSSNETGTSVYGESMCPRCG